MNPTTGEELVACAGIDSVQPSKIAAATLENAAHFPERRPILSKGAHALQVRFPLPARLSVNFMVSCLRN
jgi:hypothetical protein